MFSFGLMGSIYGEQVLPGHSSHGDVFNEGPRQGAVLMDGMGKVNLPVSTKNVEAQRFFNQGVGQLHGFWYYEAERSFRQVAMLDPDCAMAYWGCAMANVNNEGRAKGFIAEAVKLKGKASAREVAWIDALNRFYDGDGGKREAKDRHLGFIADMESIVQDYPEELEARAFLGWAIWKSKDGGVPVVSREAVDALLDGVLKREPMHPVHHYRIHLWDTGRAKRALNSAALCGQSAPGIAHMWHMPAHTYSRTNRGQDSAWAQEAALRVDHAYVARARGLTDQIHNYAHNAEWLIRVWNDLGRARASVELAKNLTSMPRHPKGNTLEKKNTAASYGRTRLLETLLKFELWDELLQLEGSSLLDVTANRAHEFARLRAMGVAAFFAGDEARLRKIVAQAGSLKKTAPKEEKKEAEKNNPKAEEKNKNPELSAEEIAMLELSMLEMMSAKKPTEEILKQIDLLKGLPDDRRVRYYRHLGLEEKALGLESVLPMDAAGQALRVEVLLGYGKRDEAKKVFEKLGELAAGMDEDLPFSRKLDEAAAELGIKEGWRKPTEASKDVRDRPSLDSLGPLHWQPVMAKTLKAKDAEGRVHEAGEAYAGKPVLVIFYLSGECSHCVSQLKAFEAAASKFKEAGVDLVAIGHETPADLVNTAKLIGEDKDLRVRLLADKNLEAFKAWGCHDDFEQSPLHGTFLLDGQGRVRWRDIAYQPFDNATFLLAEVKRLLALP